MKNLLLLSVLLVLSACGETNTAQTLDWYKAHNAEREAMLGKCKNNPGETALSGDCLNAQAAQRELDNARKGYAPLPARI